MTGFEDIGIALRGLGVAILNGGRKRERKRKRELTDRTTKYE